MELNSTALPTLTETIYKNVKQRNAGLTTGRMEEIMKRYNTDHQNSIPEVEENEQEAVDSFLRNNLVTRSRYEEDVMVNDHLSVWGSWYNTHLGWGYACCYATEKLSYCSGLKGRERAITREFKLKAEEARKLQGLRELERQAER